MDHIITAPDNIIMTANWSVIEQTTQDKVYFEGVVLSGWELWLWG